MVYKLTAFKGTGEKMMDESIESNNETEAKEKAEILLKEKGAYDFTHRLVSSDGKLILFKD